MNTAGLLQKLRLWDLSRSVSSELRCNLLVEDIITTQRLENFTEESNRDLRHCVQRFLGEAQRRYKSMKCNDRFKARNKEWLDAPLAIPKITNKGEGAGRPREEFHSISDRSKRRRTAALRQSVPVDELIYATQMKLREVRQRDLANELQSMGKAVLSDPKSASNYVPFTPDEAVALKSAARLSKASYMTVRLMLKAHQADVLPTYDELIAAQSKCYPAPHAITISDSDATIAVQGLFDLTASRVVEAHKTAFQTCTDDSVAMLWKYGLDSSTGHSPKKQITKDSICEDSILLIAAVPLQITSTERATVLWENERPSSTQLCRPLRILFTKETTAVVKNEVEALSAQINNLSVTIVPVSENKTISVHHRAVLSMVDGKVTSILSEYGSQTCNVCSATPKIMNDLDRILHLKLKANELKTGELVLHKWIRTLSLCLNIAYRLEIRKSYKTYSKDEKQSMHAKKELVQENLRNEIGILVDKPKQGGFGNTNDGNTARRFFEDPYRTARLTGLNGELLERLRVVLAVWSCGRAVLLDALRAYSLETARLYVSLYTWYPMSSAVHKVLIHGADFMEAAPIPIGLLSEEPLESRHKDIRYYRKHHVRQCSRQAGNSDLLHILLVSSDPVINSLKSAPQKKTLRTCKTVQSLLVSSPASELVFDLSNADVHVEDTLI